MWRTREDNLHHNRSRLFRNRVHHQQEAAILSSLIRAISPLALRILDIEAFKNLVHLELSQVLREPCSENS